MPTHDLNESVAAAIVAQLETVDPASWTRPWHGADPMPHNACTGRRYRVINVLELWCAAQAQGYADARWATYRQCAALGAHVRKAERGTLVLFYKDLPRRTCAETGSANTPDGAPFSSPGPPTSSTPLRSMPYRPPPANPPTHIHRHGCQPSIRSSLPRQVLTLLLSDVAQITDTGLGNKATPIERAPT